MDKQSILKFFNDNTTDKAKQNKASMIINNYGDYAVTNIGCCELGDNANLTPADKAEVRKLIRSLEAKNKKGDLNAI